MSIDCAFYGFVAADAERRTSQATIDEPCDRLTEALGCLRPEIADRKQPIKRRLRLLWAAAKICRDLGAVDVVEEEFTKFARETGVLADLGRYAAEDLAHVIRWGLLGQNPFEEGPLQ